MIHQWDTVLEALPADRAEKLSAAAVAEMGRQEEVRSLHPQCPVDVVYVGTTCGRNGEAYDYYRDNNGTYWYDSRKACEPVAVRFRYGGGILHQKSMENMRAARERHPWLQAWHGKRA